MLAKAKSKKGAKKTVQPKEKENWMLKYAGLLTEEEVQGLVAHIEATSGRKIDLGPPPENPVRGELARKRFKLK